MLSRRHLLASTAVTAALATTPETAVALLTDDDAEIFRCIAKLPALNDEADRLVDAADKIWREARKHFPALPARLKSDGEFVASMICNTKGRGTFVSMLSEDSAAPYVGTEKGRELARYEMKCETILAQHGWIEAKTAAKEARDAYHEAYDAVLSIPAETPAGMLAKLDLDPCQADYPDEVQAVIADLRRLAGRAS